MKIFGIIVVSLLAVVPMVFPSSVAGAQEPDLPPGRDHDLDPEVDERARAVQQEYQEAGREIGETHAEALRRQELKKPLEELRSAMEKEMIRLEPGLKEAILRRYEVHREMSRLAKIEQPTEEHKEQFKELGVEYSSLNETIGDLPKRAAKTPRVREASEKFREKILAVMTEINPRVPELMEQQREALSDYVLLEQELLRKHGGRPQDLSEDMTPVP